MRTAGFPPEPERFVGRVGALVRASAALAPRSGRSGVLFQGMAGGGKTTCALELAYRHQDSFRPLVWYRAPDQGSDISRSLVEFALALEQRVPGLELAHRVDRREELESFLPVLRRFLELQAVLVVVDNLESLLTGEGRWRDERWGLVVGALTEQRGLSRLVLTSRVRPAELDPEVLVEAIHALTLEESVLLARELPGPGGLMREEEGRKLVVRTLAVVRGHPKLIELADAAARDEEGLRRRLEEAERGRSAGQLRSFFEREESEATAEEHLRVLEGWARWPAWTKRA